MYVRGIRGATTVEHNDAEEILAATTELLQAVIEQNEVAAEDVGAVLITLTADLDAAFPARAIRSIRGWELVPLMCSNEVPVKGSLEKCIRLLLLVNTTKAQHEIKHVYLNKAKILRPDLVQD